MSSQDLPSITPEQIKELRLSPTEVALFEKSAGLQAESFFYDFILDHISSERLRSLDINCRKIALAFRDLLAQGTDPELAGVSAGFYFKVGGEEWNLTI